MICARIASLLLTILAAACSTPGQALPDGKQEAAPPAASSAPAVPSRQEKDLPGVTSWMQFRGDAQGTGFSHSPRPRYVGTKWKYFTADALTSGPMVCGGRVYCATETGTLHCVDAATGKKVWAAVVGPGGIGNGVVHTSPLIYDGRIYLGSRRGRFDCVDIKDGRVIWSRQLSRTEKRVELPEPIYSSPRGDARGIIVPTMDSQVFCLDPESGETRWRIETLREIGGTPVILGKSVYVACKDRQLYEIDYATGKVLRRLQLPGTTFCSPAFGLGYLFLTIGGDECVAVDLLPPLPGQPEGNRVRWKISARGEARNAMAYADGQVYVPDAGDLLAVEARSGRTLWTYKTSYKPCDPCLISDQVILASRDGFVKALDCKTGEEVFSTKLNYKIYQGPIVVGGVIYVGTLDNYLVAIE